jgi:hypothetical protein
MTKNPAQKPPIQASHGKYQDPLGRRPESEVRNRWELDEGMVKLRQQDNNIGQESGLVVPLQAEGSMDSIDAEGVPTERPISAWLDLLELTGPIDPRSSRWLQATLRFSRADGSPVFGPRGRSTTRLRALELWAHRLGDPSLAAVVSRWLPARASFILPSSTPPSPSYSSGDRALAILRPDWSVGGEIVAIDHRGAGDQTLLEVASRGRAWLGPAWTSGETLARFTRPRPTHWTSTPFADCAEWSYKAGSKRITRSVSLLRGRSIALLGQQDEGSDPSSEVRFELGEGIEASPIEGSRALLLSAGRGQPTARLIPLGLPSHDRPTDLGSIAIEGRLVVIRQVIGGRRLWLPTLICWGKPPTTWRPLTVAKQGKTCREDAAVAFRVSWGPRSEGLVVYRSLAAPALRSFIGHQTGARFLVGAFTRSGEVRPILKVGP